MIRPFLRPVPPHTPTHTRRNDTMPNHYTVEAIAANQYGGTNNYNPDWYTSRIWLVKTRLIKLGVDLNRLFGRLENEEDGVDPNVSPEALLDEIARMVIKEAGKVVEPLTKDLVKRLILFCALTPDIICNRSDLIEARALLTPEESHEHWRDRMVDRKLIIRYE